MNKVVGVIGQMNVDVIYRDINRMPNKGEEVFASDFKIALGGGPMVIPIQLNLLGVKNKLGTYLGNDFQSRISGDLLNEINYHNVTVLNTLKKHPVVVTSVLTSIEERSFVCYNEGANEIEAGADQVYEFYKECSVIFCPQDPVVAKRLKDEGKTVVFDVGWKDDLSLEGIKEYLEICDYFTPNEKEIEKIMGSNDYLECLDRLSEYLKFPIIKLGSRGCICKHNNEYIYVPSMQFNTIDPTGAGDNFLTGLIYGLILNADPIECLKYGNVFGGLSTEVLGCFRFDLSEELINKYYYNYPEIEKYTTKEEARNSKKFHCV